MLYRVVRPMKRDGSRIPIFVQRIPADIKARAVGTRLAIPLGDGFALITVSARAQAVRFSLRTADPSQIKSRQAIAAFASFHQSSTSPVREINLDVTAAGTSLLGACHWGNLLALGSSE